MNKIIMDDGLIFDDTRKNVVFRENKVSYQGINENGKKVRGYQIDGKLIYDGKKCDKGLEIIDDNIFTLIELKGKDLSYACLQINQTIECIKNELKQYKINARIVLTRVQAPDLECIEYKKLSRVVRMLGGDLKKESRELKEKI